MTIARLQLSSARPQPILIGLYKKQLQIAYQNNNPQEVLSITTKLLELMADPENLYEYRSWAFFNLGDIQSIVAANKAIALNASVNNYLMRIEAKIAFQKYFGVEKDLDKLKILDPKNAWIYEKFKAHVFRFQAIKFILKKRYEKSLEACELSLKIERNISETWKLKGHTEVLLHNISAALRSYDNSLRYYKNVYSYNSLYTLYLFNKDHKKGQALLENFVLAKKSTLHPQNLQLPNFAPLKNSELVIDTRRDHSRLTGLYATDETMIFNIINDNTINKTLPNTDLNNLFLTTRNYINDFADKDLVLVNTPSTENKINEQIVLMFMLFVYLLIHIFVIIDNILEAKTKKQNQLMQNLLNQKRNKKVKKLKKRKEHVLTAEVASEVTENHPPSQDETITTNHALQATYQEIKTQIKSANLTDKIVTHIEMLGNEVSELIKQDLALLKKINQLPDETHHKKNANAVKTNLDRKLNIEKIISQKKYVAEDLDEGLSLLFDTLQQLNEDIRANLFAQAENKIEEVKTLFEHAKLLHTKLHAMKDELTSIKDHCNEKISLHQKQLAHLLQKQERQGKNEYQKKQTQIELNSIIDDLENKISHMIREHAIERLDSQSKNQIALQTAKDSTPTSSPSSSRIFSEARSKSLKLFSKRVEHFHHCAEQLQVLLTAIYLEEMDLAKITIYRHALMFACAQLMEVASQINDNHFFPTRFARRLRNGIYHRHQVWTDQATGSSGPSVADQERQIFRDIYVVAKDIVNFATDESRKEFTISAHNTTLDLLMREYPDPNQGKCQRQVEQSIADKQLVQEHSSDLPPIVVEHATHYAIAKRGTYVRMLQLFPHAPSRIFNAENNTIIQEAKRLRHCSL